MSYKHSQSFIISSTSGVWSSFDGHPSSNRKEEETSQQTEEASVIHCRGTCNETFVQLSIICPELTKVGRCQVLSAFILDDRV